MMRGGRRQGHGFTLIEMMLALVAGLIVSAAALSFFLSSMKSNGEYVQSTRLTQELRNSLDLITRDLRRAGYDEKALGYLATGSASGLTHICRTTGGSNTCITNGSVGDCIIYAYDSGDASAVDGQVDPDYGEVRGIRRKTDTINGVANTGIIEYAVSRSGFTKPACGDAKANYTSFPPSCNGVWCPLSDPTRLNVTSLTFTDVGGAAGQVLVRNIDVVLQAQLAGSATFTRGVKTSVRIRSDCFDATLTNCNSPP